MLRDAMDAHDPEAVLTILNDPTCDYPYDFNDVLEWASYYNYVDVVERVLRDPEVDPTHRKNDALWSACEFNHMEIVKLLIDDPRVDPFDCNHEVIRYAADDCNSVLVKCLVLQLYWPHNRIDEIPKDVPVEPIIRPLRMMTLWVLRECGLPKDLRRLIVEHYLHLSITK